MNMKSILVYEGNSSVYISNISKYLLDANAKIYYFLDEDYVLFSLFV